jgi:hypothetical protein
MTHLDYTFERQIELEREASREEGREEGLTSIIKMMLRRGRTPEAIAEFCGYPLNEVERIAKNVND